MKRLEIAPGFIAALCLLRLLVEPGVFWSFLAAAAAHEAGHLTAAFALHVKVTGIRLDALDARIRMQASSYRQETICALAGPAASVLLCIAMRKADPACAAISLLLGLFNALPVFPLDGGRALRAMLGLFLPLSRAEAISGWIGLAVCAAGLQWRSGAFYCCGFCAMRRKRGLVSYLPVRYNVKDYEKFEVEL